MNYHCKPFIIKIIVVIYYADIQGGCSSDNSEMLRSHLELLRIKYRCICKLYNEMIKNKLKTSFLASVLSFRAICHWI